MIGQYRSGYAQCMTEVTRYLGSGNAADSAPELRTRLLGHLANMVTPGQQGQQQQQQIPRTSTPLTQQQQSPVAFQLQQQTHTVEGANIVKSAVPPMQVITHVQQLPSPTSVPVRIAPAPEGTRTEYSFSTSEPAGQLSPVAVRTHASTNSAQILQSVPVGVPSATLPSGEITLVLPPEALQNGQVPTHFIPVYAPAAGSATVLSPIPKSNIPSASAAPSQVSMSSPRAASSVPAMSPTRPQSSLTIPAQHAQVTQPPTQVTYCVPVQTKLSPPVREYKQHQEMEPARERVSVPVTDGRCVAKSDPMWRPW